jgi:hypothetical protein
LSDEITARREPDYAITAIIEGRRIGDTGKTRWHIEIEGEANKEQAADILDCAAEVLREAV